MKRITITMLLFALAILVKAQSKPSVNIIGDNLYFRNSRSANARVSIYDMHGQMVLTQMVANNSVDISPLAKGIYLVKLENDGKTLTHKLMKE
jgi:hypothetical protein